MQEIQPRLVGACSITVGETEVTPAASHLFALLLALVIAPRDSWTRRTLQELLFAGADDRVASHRLRQLMYRLRTFGIALQESPEGLLRVANPIADFFGPSADGMRPHGDAAGDALTTVLGLYAPRMPVAYLEWLEERREALQRMLVVRRLSELRAARERQDWPVCARLGAELHRADALNEETTVILAESQAMLGQRDAAIETIDGFLRESGDALDDRPLLRKLRARILSTRVPRREGTMRGREECLAFLAEQWELTTSGGAGRACTIFGPPGMGKTRVGESFAGTVRLAGGQVIQHRCDEHARSFPLALFSRLVPDLRRRRGSIGADPALGAVLDHLAPSATPSTPEQTPPEIRRDELRRAIIDLFEAVTAEQPMLIVVDDAHLLDDASRAVIRSLADSDNSAHLLVLLLCRPRPDGASLLSASRRFASYVLPPLSDADSRALLLELTAHRQPSEEEVAWAVEQASGNAFYLNALAQHPGALVSLPAHIKSLAQTGYLSLSIDARSILDASLLLDTLATPERVTRACAADERALLGALRELEEADLLRCEDGLFVGPHAILRDALGELMPSMTRVVLHRRIATMLSAECEDPAQARIVAWAAVSSWLSAGDSVAAVRLALQVARHAAALGEPGAGAMLLSRIPRDSISLELRRELLDEISVLADAGSCLSLLSLVLRERADIARRGEGASAAASFELRAIANDYVAGRYKDSPELSRILTDKDVSGELRAEAATRLLAVAHLSYDQANADDVHGVLLALESGELADHPRFLRAQLVYHTTFGDVEKAFEIANRLVRTFPRPSVDYEPRISFSYAMYAFLRLGDYEASARLGTCMYEYMKTKRNLTGVEYAGAIAGEAYCSLGNFDAARRLHTAIQSFTRPQQGSESAIGSGMLSLAIQLALAEKDLSGVQRLLSELKTTVSCGERRRMRALTLSYRLREIQLRGDSISPSPLVAELTELFQHGKNRGGQDIIAEAIWQAKVDEGDLDGASEMLKTYLGDRRERGQPEASLRLTSAADPVWLSYSPHG